MKGTVINNYRILDEIDRGGMGVVYRAEHVTMGQRAVVKQLLPQFTKNPEIVARFFQEARAAAAIDDPGIVKMFDQGTLPDGSAYITMELLAGESLAKRLRRGALPSDLAIAVVRQAARVLGAAHGRRIVHRDLKPDNLFLVPDPDVSGGMRVKVLDFGIAKLMAGDSGGPQTHTGLSMGTPQYMAPEQWRSAGRVDERADVYAMGCILYETLAGRPPFPGPGLPEFMDQHRFDAPPMPGAVDAALARFDPVVRRSMAKTPEDRYLTMEALASALGALARPSQDEVPTQSPPPPPRARLATPGPTTTLGGAAAETTQVRAARRGRRAIFLGVAGAAVVAGVTAGVFVTGRGDTKKVKPSPKPQGEAPRPEPAKPTVAALPEAPPAAKEDPAWVRVAAPQRRVLLGVAERADGIPDDVYGFRPAAEVYAPAEPYEIQAREVAWGELDPWLAAHPDRHVERPDFIPADEPGRRDLPATGIPWDIAAAYCLDHGGRLPSEQEWEYAARGEERRPYAWGAAPLDLASTHAYAGDDATLVAVGASTQDVTPTGVHDLMGNAQEWTGGPWREDDDKDAPIARPGANALHAVRGLPLAEDPPASLPAEGAAYRDRLCGGDCSRDWKDLVRYVGFRCARDAR